MPSIEVEALALHAAARSIGDIADTLTSGGAPDPAVPGVQATGAAVRAVHAATRAAASTMAARLRSTASAMAAGGTSFADTERSSTEAITAVAPTEN
jgi:hypothetical protein